MRLPDEVLKSVVFLGPLTSGTERFSPRGTGFLVSDNQRQFLVTAKHVVEKLGTKFQVRYNTDAGAADQSLLDKSWFCSSDDSVDAAVLPWTLPTAIDCRLISRDLFVGPDRMSLKDIGVGDDIYATGLFSPVAGGRLIRPIVRTGHLAMSPPEEVAVEEYYTPKMLAYLVELRSLGGLSGSPVFVQRSVKVQPADTSGRQPLGAGAIFLLGIMHGHWRIPASDLDYVSVREEGDQKKDRRDSVHSGIAMVTPAEKILEILDQANSVMSKPGALHDWSAPTVTVGVSAGPTTVLPSSRIDKQGNS